MESRLAGRGGTDRLGPFTIVIAIACLGVGLAQARAQEENAELPLSSDNAVVIKQIEWGFDGKAVRRTFTPLSVLIQNNTASPVSGSLRLWKSLQLSQRVDVEYVQDYYVSGFSSRWVQLTPYVINDYESWTLAWGDGRAERAEIPTPRMGDRATVLVVGPDEVSGVGGVLRRCDPAIFPVSVTGTDSLRGVVLDRAPDWQGARAQAFLDWLRGGGRVYLLQGPDDEFPRFAAELAVLNDERDRFRMGSGLIQRLPLRAEDIDYQTAQKMILDDEKPPVTDEQRRSIAAVSFGGMMGWDRDQQLLIDLEQSARFHRNWWLVYLAVLVYLFAMYPGCYLLGRSAPDWRTFYVGFLSTSAAFSLLFYWIGRVGSGELSRVRSVAIAHQLEDGLYDVTQWSCVAAVTGDMYDVQHRGSGRVYSTCQEIEAVNGAVHLAEGRLAVDLPPASTRTVLHRARIAGPKLGLSLREVAIDERGLSQFAVLVGKGIPKPAFAYAWYMGQIYVLSIGNTGMVAMDRGVPGAGFLNNLQEYMLLTNPWTGRPEEEHDADKLLKDLHRGLIGNSFGLLDQLRPEDVVLPADQLRVFLYLPMPPEFRMQGELFPDQKGYVLYVVDFPVTPPARSP